MYTWSKDNSKYTELEESMLFAVQKTYFQSNISFVILEKARLE